MFKIGDIVEWGNDNGKSVGTITQIGVEDHHLVKVDWDILNPNNYSYCIVSQKKYADEAFRKIKISLGALTSR